MNKPEEFGQSIEPTLSVELVINGAVQSFRVNGSERLSSLLREQCGLTGTKIGCHAGDCGACTVLLDGAQVCACLIPASQLVGTEVTTVEALADLTSSDGRPVGQRLGAAFAQLGAAQCGICTPGMLMAAAEVLLAGASPTRAQVLDALGGVLCRCTGYLKIIEAVLLAGSDQAIEDFSVNDLPADELAVVNTSDLQPSVGRRQVRLDVADKLDGRAIYGADEAPPGALDLWVLRSPYARAGFEFGDFAAWQQRHPGVRGVITAQDIPNNQFAIFAELRDQPALAESETRFPGEAVLAVVGTAAALQDVIADPPPIEFTELPAITTTAAATEPGAHSVQERYPDNILCRGHLRQKSLVGDSVQPTWQVGAHMTTGYLEHAYLEPDAGYAVWHDPGSPFDVTVFVSTQTPYLDRDEVAWMFDLVPARVRIVPSVVGGGFGGKLDLAVQPLVVAAARKFEVPVRLVMERPDTMISTTKRHPAQMQASLNADASGHFLAYEFNGDFNTGAYASWGPTVANRVPIHASGPYRYDAVLADTRAILTNGAVSGAFRGFGVPQAALITETLIDLLADELGTDPLELRLLNALRAGDKTPCGQTLNASVGLVACLQALRPAWHAAQLAALEFNDRAINPANNEIGAQVSAAPRPGSGTDPHHLDGLSKRRGVGVACMWYGIGNTVIANPSTMVVGLRASGRLMLYNGAVDIGQGTYTIMPQICADSIGLPISLFDQIYADTGLTEDAGKSSASRQTFVSGNAARFAGEQLRSRLCEFLGVSGASRLSIEGSYLVAHGTDSNEDVVKRDLTQLPVDDNGDVFTGRGFFDPPTEPLDKDGQGVPYATYGFAAQFAVVEVDIELGTTRVLDIHAAHDVGRAINPTQVEGQIHGGIAQGLGLALMEEYRGGRTDNLHDYLIPSVGDMPPVTTYLIEDHEPLGPFGAKGVGEPALVATAPAILNAIRHATGVTLDQVPVTPDRLLAALKR